MDPTGRICRSLFRSAKTRGHAQHKLLIQNARKKPNKVHPNHHTPKKIDTHSTSNHQRTTLETLNKTTRKENLSHLTLQTCLQVACMHNTRKHMLAFVPGVGLQVWGQSGSSGVLFRMKHPMPGHPRRWRRESSDAFRQWRAESRCGFIGSVGSSLN